MGALSVKREGGNVNVALFFSDNKLLASCFSFLSFWRLFVCSDSKMETCELQSSMFHTVCSDYPGEVMSLLFTFCLPL